MAHCLYCQERSGLISQICRDCRRLIRAVKGLEGAFGYGALLDALLETGVHQGKIEKFLDADPDGTGSLSQKVTARMTNELMGDLGQPSQMSARDVKKVQEKVASGESYLDEPDE